MDNTQDTDTSVITDEAAGEGHADHPEEIVVEADGEHIEHAPGEPEHTEHAPEPEPAPPMPSYEELLANVQQLVAGEAISKGTIEQLNEQVSHQSVIIADLNSQLAAMSESLTAARDEALIQDQKLASRSQEIEGLTRQLDGATKSIAEFNRQREQYKLWAARAPGDTKDRMVLAEDAGKAADKVAGAERITLAAPSLVW